MPFAARGYCYDARIGMETKRMQKIIMVVFALGSVCVLAPCESTGANDSGDLSPGDIRRIYERTRSELDRTPPPRPAPKHKSPRPDDLLDVDLERILSVVPDQPPVAQPCPVCGKDHGWKWSPKHPFTAACKKCGTEFPNDNYPPDDEQTFTNVRGEKIKIPYYKGDDGRRYYIANVTDGPRLKWFLGSVIPRLTGYVKAAKEKKAARHLALVMHELALRYPHWLNRHGSRAAPAFFDCKRSYYPNGCKEYTYTPRDKRKRDWRGGKFDTVMNREIKPQLFDAYNAIKNHPVMADLSKELGHDVRKTIRDDLLIEMINFVRIRSDDNWGNLMPFFAAMAKGAWSTNDPPTAHAVYRWCTQHMKRPRVREGGQRGGYFFDLHEPEGPQGHKGLLMQTYGNFSAIMGWSDPPGYVCPADGLHLQDVGADDLPYFRDMIYVPEIYTLPNGAVNALDDTYAGYDYGRRHWYGFAFALRYSRCRMAPGYGQAVLGDGTGDDQVQVQMNFNRNGGHNHGDNLSMVWFAHGQELSGEIAYHRMQLRLYSGHPFSHNQVVVNRRLVDNGDTFGNVEFFNRRPGVSAVQVENTKAYAHVGAKLYRRTLILNSRDADAPYFVDVFEVDGGRTHDYSIHGSVLDEQNAAASLEMDRMDEKMPLLEEGETFHYPPPGQMGVRAKGPVDALLRDVSQATPNENFHVDFTYKERPDLGTRIHMFADERAKFYLGRTPSLRKCPGKGPQAYKHGLDYWMPHFVVRRRVGKGESLKSVFLAVYDMYDGEPSITSVRRLDAGDDAVALEIKHADSKTDTIVYSLGGAREMSTGGVEMHGKLGLVSQKGAKADGYLMAGRYLRAGGVNLESDAPEYTGVIISATRKYDGAEDDTFAVDADLPAGEELRGRWMIVTHPKEITRYGRGDPWPRKPGPYRHAYKIRSIEKTGGETIVHLGHDHGLRTEGDITREVFAPGKWFKGDNTFVIHNACCTVPAPVIRPSSGPWDITRMEQYVPFVDKVEVSIDAPASFEIKYTTDGTRPGADSRDYTGPFTLSDSAVVKAVVISDGVMEGRVASQRFVAAAEPVGLESYRQGVRVTDSTSRDVHTLLKNNSTGSRLERKMIVRSARDGQINPKDRGVMRYFDLGDADGRGQDSQRVFEGYFLAPRDGMYEFRIRGGQTGVSLRVAGVRIIDTFGMGPFRHWSARIPLKAGFHRLRLGYLYGWGDKLLKVSVTTPGGQSRTLAPWMLYVED